MQEYDAFSPPWFSCTLKKTDPGSPASLPTKKSSCWAARNKDPVQVPSGPCAGTGAESPPHHLCNVRQQHPHCLRSQTFLVPKALSGINYFRHNSNTFLWNNFQEFRTKKPQAGSHITHSFWRASEVQATCQLNYLGAMRTGLSSVSYCCWCSPFTFRTDNSASGSDWHRKKKIPLC